MTINGESFNIMKITGYSKEVQKLNGHLEEVRNTEKNIGSIKIPKIEQPKIKVTGYTGEVRQLTNEAKKTSNEYSFWTKIVRQYYALLDQVKMKMAQLGKEAKQTGNNQERMTSFFSLFKEKISKVDIGKIFQAFSGIPKITAKISNHIKNMGMGIKNGISHVLKYAGALFSLRGIYSTLSNSASAWLSSQNAGAQQFSTNIDYLKNSLR